MTTWTRRIGGSRAAAALGQSPWQTPLDIYLECRGEQPAPEGDDDMSADAERGVMLEPALIAWASKKLGIEFSKPPESIPSSTLEFAAVSPDGLGADLLSYLEIKAPRSHDGYGDEMTDQVPGHVLLQVVHGLMVTDRRVAYIGALLNGTLKLFKYERDIELETMVRDGERRLWTEHVLKGLPPPPQYGDEQNIRRRFPKNTEPHVLFDSLPTAEQRVVEQWAEFNRKRTEAAKFEETFKASVMNICGTRSGIAFGPSHHIKRIDFSQNKASPDGGTWKAVSEELLARLPADEAKALVAKYTKAEGARVLKGYFQKAKE